MSGTATEIMPVFINVSQTVVTMLANYEVFDNISLLSFEIGLSAFAILCALIVWLRTRGGEIDNMESTEFMSRPNFYRERYGRKRR